MIHRFIIILSIICYSTLGIGGDLTFRDQLKKLEADYTLNEPYFEKFLEWTSYFGQSYQDQKQLLDFFKFFAELHPIDRNIYFLGTGIFSNYQAEFSTLEEWLGAVRSLDRLFLKANSIIDPRQPFPPYSWNEELGHYYRYFLHLKRSDKLPPWNEFEGELKDMQSWFSKRGDRPAGEKPLFVWEGRFYTDAKDELEKLKNKILAEPIRFGYFDEEDELRIESSFPMQKDSVKVMIKMAHDPKELFERAFPWTLIEDKTRYYTDEDGREMLQVVVNDLDGDELILDFVIYSESSKRSKSGVIYYTLEPSTFSVLNAVLSLWEIKCSVHPHERFRDISVVSIQSKTVVRALAKSFKGNLTRGGKTKELLDKQLPSKLSGLREYLLKD